MTTFDLGEVREFTSDLDARMDRCDNGEGMECANFDATLRHYAEFCCEFCEAVREWGRSVFHGTAAFDPAVERLWLNEGRELYSRAVALWDNGLEMEGKCFVLDHGAALGAALHNLSRLLSSWVTPRLAVSPLARRGFAASDAEKAEVQQRVAALPALPSDWEPADPRRRMYFRKLLTRRKPQ